jgi:hypothetical protein
MQGLSSSSQSKGNLITALIGLVVAVFLGALTATYGIAMPAIFVGTSCAALLLITFFDNPKSALYTLLIYCFTSRLFARELGVTFPIGVTTEILIGITFLVAIFRVSSNKWKNVHNDLFFLTMFWLALSILEVGNPAGANPLGWLKELRASTLYPALVVVISLAVFDKIKDLNSFLFIIILLSTIGALNGIKQLHIGLSAADQKFLRDGADVTHIVFGKLRVFSFYSEAAQFGSSQAHIGLIALILALGPFKRWIKISLFIASGLMFYGMLISGTRGALFALIIGAFFAIFLSKKFKALIIGGIFCFGFLFFLKYTYIGNGNYQIYRLRSALDPQDASLNVRFTTQKVLREYMSSRPFGAGLGTIGSFARQSNPGTFLSIVQPDSYWVKVWAMYGIVGFIIWLGIMMYILGKCCGIVWKIKDKGLKIKGIALTSGFAGILFCSYGNEVINTMPSSIVVAMSWVFIYMMPRFDDRLAKRNKIY